MPITTRNEYAELCGDDILKINMWIKRGKIIHIENDKKHIDTENPVNALFLSERQEFNRSKSLGLPTIVSVKLDTKMPNDIIIDTKVSKTVTKTAKSVTKIPKKVTEKPIKSPKFEAPAPIDKLTAEQKRSIAREREDQNRRALLKVDQEAQKRQQDIDLTELRIQSEKIRLDKTAGNLLPIDLGMSVIERHANSILKTYEKGFEQIGDIYATLAGFDPDRKAEFMKECRVKLGECVENAGKLALEEIDILVDNYAETLMTGQRKA